MTTPTDRTRALVQTKQFLRELTDKTDMPRVPQSVRDIARRLSQNYPTYADIGRAHEAMPERYAPLPPHWHFRAKRLVGRSGTREEKGDFEPLTPEQHAVISRAEPGQRGKTVSSLFDLADDHLFTVDAARKSEHPD